MNVIGLTHIGIGQQYIIRDGIAENILFVRGAVHGQFFYPASSKARRGYFIYTKEEKTLTRRQEYRERNIRFRELARQVQENPEQAHLDASDWK